MMPKDAVPSHAAKDEEIALLRADLAQLQGKVGKLPG